MTREKHKAIASLGGKSAHAKGLAHQWDSKEASVAGKKGAAARTANHKRRKIA